MIKLYLPVLIIFMSVSAAFASQHRVLYVVDGDTLVIEEGNVHHKVRLIGIDTPESRYNYKTLRDSKRTHQDIQAIIRQGKRAASFVKTLVKGGDYITLEFDAEKYDRYGRFLAYVYLSDGRMLNDLIVRAGYASPMTIAPNVKYSSLFRKSYRYAREKKAGLWK